MNDYYSVRINSSPCPSDKISSEDFNIDDVNDLVAAFLAEEGFESFEPDQTGLTAYISVKECGEKDVVEIVQNSLENFPIHGVDFSISSEFIKGKDWNEEWEKNYFKPILIDDICVVHSTFHHDVPLADYDIIIDPKMAFGTGHHDTTSQMMRLILSLPLADKSVIDMGTGTGILAILAKMRGASVVTGIEIDESAYVNAVEHSMLNHVDVKMIHGDATSLKSIAPADFIFANINRNIILQDFKFYTEALKKDGEMLLSGFYESDVEILNKAFSEFGFKIADMLVSPAGWTALRIAR